MLSLDKVGRGSAMPSLKSKLLAWYCTHLSLSLRCRTTERTTTTMWTDRDCFQHYRLHSEICKQVCISLVGTIILLRRRFTRSCASPCPGTGKQLPGFGRIREVAVLLPSRPLGQQQLHHQPGRRGGSAHRVCAVRRSVH